MTHPPLTADLIGQLVRSCFVASPGRTLGVVDLAQIEARTLLWLAGDEQNLATFTSGDPYVAFAAKLFGLDYEALLALGKSPQRQIGKTGVLGCLAAGTRVLTWRGWVEIERVLLDDRVWDGVEWVRHRGVVAKGDRPCMRWAGVTLTPDHLMLTPQGWEEAWVAATTETSPSALGSESGLSWPCAEARRAAWSGSYAVVPAVAPASPRSTTSSTGSRRGATHAQSERLGERRASEGSTSWPHTSEKPGSTGSVPPSLDATGSRTAPTGATAREAFGFMLLGAAILWRSCATWLRFLASTIFGSAWTGSTTTAATSPATSAWRPKSSSAGTAETTEAGESWRSVSGAEASSGSASGASGSAVSPALLPILPTFDLSHAGPRNRFVVWPGVVVHNCGFGAGPDAIDRVARKDGIDLAAAGLTGVAVVEGWRRQHPMIAGREVGRTFVDAAGRERQARRGGYWRRTETAARRALLDGDVGAVGAEGREVTWQRDGVDLLAVLPSGRALRYRNAGVDPEQNLCYVDAKRGLIRTYGGRLTENCFGRGTQVVTLRGILPIAEVKPGDSVWDGVEWVLTAGAVSRGVQEVGEWLGVSVTPDHRILAGSRWVSAIHLDESATHASLAAGRSLAGSLCSRLAEAGAAPRSAAANVASTTVSKTGLYGVARCSVGGVGWPQQGELGSATTISSRAPASRLLGLTVTPAWFRGATTPSTRPTPTTAVEGCVYARSGSTIDAPSSSTPRLCPGGTSQGSTSTAQTTAGGMSPGTCVSSLGASTRRTAETPFAFSTQGRSGHTASGAERSCLAGLRTPRDSTSSEAAARSGLWRDTKQLMEVFDLLNCGPRERFTVLTAAGPVIAHNCVQAAARDVVAHALPRLEEAGYPVVLHVHDEVVCELPLTEPELHLARVQRIMETPPAWAAGLPIKTEGHHGRRYGK